MDKQNVSNILNSLLSTHHATMTQLHTAQCEACKGLDSAEAVEVILRLQRIAAKVDRAFSFDINQLDELLADW